MAAQALSQDAPRHTHLHTLQQPRECLLPRQRVHVLLCVDDADFTLQLGDDGTCAPAVPQHEVLGAASTGLSTHFRAPSPHSPPHDPVSSPHRQVTVQVVSEVEHTGATPFCQTQEVKQVSLGKVGDTTEPTVLKGLPWGC